MAPRLPVLLALMTLAPAAGEAACFVAETTPPTRAEVLGDAHLGQSGRDLALALLGRDWTAAERLLAHDPALGKLKVGAHHDMVSVAVASCDPAAIDLVARHGAPLDGVEPAVPLSLALRATKPDLAYHLLKAGAAPNPKGNAAAPISVAIELGSVGAVRMLLDFHADPNVMESTGNRPLQTALDMEQFRIAELLLDRGADPWAIDGNGGNFGSSLEVPMLKESPEEAAARDRLKARRAKLGWPAPVPDIAQVRALALAGKWPPAKGAKPVPAEVMALIRNRAERGK